MCDRKFGCDNLDKIQGIRNISDIKEINRFKKTHAMYNIQEIRNTRGKNCNLFLVLVPACLFLQLGAERAEETERKRQSREGKAKTTKPVREEKTEAVRENKNLFFLFLFYTSCHQPFGMKRVSPSFTSAVNLEMARVRARARVRVKVRVRVGLRVKIGAKRDDEDSVIFPQDRIIHLNPNPDSER